MFTNSRKLGAKLIKRRIFYFPPSFVSLERDPTCEVIEIALCPVVRSISMDVMLLSASLASLFRSRAATTAATPAAAAMNYSNGLFKSNFPRSKSFSAFHWKKIEIQLLYRRRRRRHRRQRWRQRRRFRENLKHKLCRRWKRSRRRWTIFYSLPHSCSARSNGFPMLHDASEDTSMGTRLLILLEP